MRPQHYAQLCAIARRQGSDAAGAEDVVQEALLAAVEAGRGDLALAANARWLSGVVRNRARMMVRSAARRRRREGQWQQGQQPADPPERTEAATWLATLAPSLKAVAALTLSGHNRREIAYLLGLSDAALRQRVTALKRQLKARGIAAPRDLPGLGLDLAYGRIRDALLPQLIRQGGVFASHDPDGHLFIVTRSQEAGRRQLQVQPSKEGSP